MRVLLIYLRSEERSAFFCGYPFGTLRLNNCYCALAIFFYIYISSIIIMSEHSAIMPVKVRKSSRLTERVALRDDETTIQRREYTLNLVKALKKKASQCTLELKIVEETKGQNRIFIMSGGVYELYRLALLTHYENMQTSGSSPYDVQIKSVKDKQGMFVESQVRVSYKRSGRSRGLLRYTVNLYHTRSSMRINGNEAYSFTDDHKKAIDSILAIQNLDTIDQGLHQIIFKELDKIQFNAPNTKVGGSPEPKLAAAPDGSGTAECGSDLGSSQRRGFPLCFDMGQCDPTGEGDGGDDGSIYICTHCDMPSTEQVIECSVCSNWYHYVCEGISEIEFEKHCVDEDSLYSCMSCLTGQSCSEQSKSNMGGPVEPDHCSNEPQPLRVITPDCTGGENKEFPPQTVNKGNSSPGHKLNLGPQSPVIGAIALHDTTGLTPHSSYNDSQNILSPTDISEYRTNDRGANLNTQNDEGIPVPTGTEVQGPTHAMVDKSCSTQNITIRPDLTDEQQPSHLHPSPVSCITYTPTCVESLRGLHPNEPPQAVGDSDNIRGAGCMDPPSILVTSQLSCVPSQQPVMSESTNNCYNESQMSVKGLQQKRKTAKKPQGARAKKQDSDGVGTGTDNLSSLSSLRGAVSSDDTNPIIPQDDEGASLNDQLLKSKEKLLSTKERKLKDLEKKLHLKEINMSDQLEQNEYSKTYILTMEHKLKELENTNRLLKMKMLCQEEMGSMGGKHKESDTEIHLPHRTTDTPSPHTDSELHARVAHMEIRLLEHRINTLEQNLWSRQNQPSYTHAQYDAVYGPPSNVYGPPSTQYPPFHSYPVGYHYPPYNWYGPYWHQNTYPPINTFQPVRHTTWPETRSNVRSATGTLPCTDNEKPQYSTHGYQMEQTVPKRAQPSGITIPLPMLRCLFLGKLASPRWERVYQTTAANPKTVRSRS